jgi:hypothetical protein
MGTTFLSLVPKAIPYGIYDIGHNKGFVNVGIDHDTSKFSVASIRTWWIQIGKKDYPNVKYLLITADGGGSNGSRNRLWKFELHKLSKDIGIPIKVCHYPPNTSKWNAIEHKMFSFISSNWRGVPLDSYELIINYIKHTTTETGLTINATLDKRKYETGIKVSKKEFEAINLCPEQFHGNWNYTIS